jgi:hypothetical protein
MPNDKKVIDTEDNLNFNDDVSDMVERNILLCILEMATKLSLSLK